jgi:glycosyltransferase involved in cell wall biosynthesis
MPAGLSQGAADAARPTRLSTALSARALAREKRAQFRRMVAAADRIVAVCGWLEEALRRNGVPEEKLVLSRQGVSFDPTGQAATQPVADKTCHVGFLGRWHETKGLHVLLGALRLLPADLPIQLHLFGMCSSDEDRAYRAKVLAGLEGDPRLKLEQPVAREHVPAVLARLDLLADPSQCLETGPLVVLEAQAMGVPVLGSDLGGIQELVTHGVDGWLVDPRDCAAWADAIVRAAKGDLLPAQAEPRRRVRHMADAARDMAGLYESLLADA